MGSHVELVRQMRQNPECLSVDSRSLAREYGVDLAVVEAAKATLRQSNRPPKSASTAPVKWTGLRDAVGRFRSVVGRILDAQLPLVIGVSVMSILISVASGIFDIPISGVWIIILGILLPYVVLILTSYHSGRVNTVWPAVLASGILPGVMIGTSGAEGGILLGAMSGLAFMMFGVVVLAGLAALGGFFRHKREREVRARLTRAQKLARILEIRSLLDQAPPPTKPSRWETLVAWVRARWLGYVLVTSLAYSLSTIAFIWYADPTGTVMRFTPESLPDFRIFAGLMVFAVLSLLNNFFIGWTRPRPAWIWLGLLILFGAGAIPSAAVRLIPELAWMEALVNPFSKNSQAYLGLVMNVIIVLSGSVAATIAETRDMWRRQAQGDAAALVAELIRLESELQTEGTPTAVLAVDVAGSTRMKQDVDEVAVEWSFRRYHEILLEASRGERGRLVSTAGDGAILSFASPDEAIRAAIAAQGAIETFNANENRMPHPFRLRFGLHYGLAPVDLAEVQINRLIDVAAHLEGIAGEGGLAMTQEAREALQDDYPLVPGEELDGHLTYRLPDLRSVQPPLERTNP